jgi:phage/plasmid-like protein (TIGR03299 family)
MKAQIKGASQQEKTFEILEATKTNWSVNKLPLQSTCGLITDSFGTFRSSDGKYFGSVKGRYEVMQNSTMVEMLVDATDQLGLNIVNGGDLRGGKNVFYQIELESRFIGQSDVKRYITSLNSHDGSCSIGLGSSNMVVACSNTFTRTMRDLERVRHTSSAKERIEELVKSLRKAIIGDEIMMEGMSKMADILLKDEIVERLVKKMFSISMDTSLSTLKDLEKEKIVSFSECLDKEIKLEGATVWGLFNAVTRYTNHVLAPDGKAKREQYLMLGAGSKLSNLAFDELMRVVEANTTEYHMVGL